MMALTGTTPAGGRTAPGGGGTAPAGGRTAPAGNGGAGRTMRAARTRAELTAATSRLPAPRGVVMTMGALHEGHAELLRVARSQCASVVATLFVNPLQFGVHEDLDRYPRTFDADLALCLDERVDVLFAPGEAEMYPNGRPETTVDPGPLGEQLEGASRPGHFAGVLTVVLKLLHLTHPDRAYFGEKDYQQLTLIRAMVRDLDLDVEIVAVPTVREADGLALSSRNRYLSPAERHDALALSRALQEGAAAGPYGREAVLAAAQARVAGIGLDYLELRDPDLGPAPDSGPARLLVAARVGPTRLIDNAGVTLGPRAGTPGATPDTPADRAGVPPAAKPAETPANAPPKNTPANEER
jgi:pantoate--beta-alanine ligase